ncbi:DNA-J related domain-containing protein [Pseudomonas sp. GCM10022188]|uniref:DNA-J related domain-containing protein n=1 Tax=Pseudomonas TaxID=286 RepID=UPI001E33232B|nr:DNA-J related domain-containing protein [Pseudomonas oryzagri]MCC6077152.1 DnaJ domain-containing protein [Pseudomonas oryzagri]
MNTSYDPAIDLMEQLLALLRRVPDGLSEHQLIRRLREAHCTHLPQLPLTDKLVLFRTHFLLFNALYRLRDRLWGERSAHLEINPLLIRLLPYQDGPQALGEHDPLRAYYLDEARLRDTTEADVVHLLQSFWTRMHGGEEREAALELFGLDARADYSAIRLRYRQLVSQHHPDRGGSTTRLQSINKAMEILDRYYKPA